MRVREVAQHFHHSAPIRQAARNLGNLRAPLLAPREHPRVEGLTIFCVRADPALQRIERGVDARAPSCDALLGGRPALL
jgi:hypothetical protein